VRRHGLKQGTDVDERSGYTPQHGTAVTDLMRGRVPRGRAYDPNELIPTANSFVEMMIHSVILLIPAPVVLDPQHPELPALRALRDSLRQILVNGCALNYAVDLKVIPVFFC
jgi:hypothetical protein